jgi:hypothetical protein
MRCSGGSSLPRSEPAWHRAGGNHAGRGKKEERRRAFSLLLDPLLRWCGVGWTRALARTTCLSFSLDFSQRALALAGVKRGACSYSLHFSRASPSSPLPGLALLAPALLPLLPSLLSVIILLTHLLVVSRTPFSRATRWVRVASLSSLLFLSSPFPSFFRPVKTGMG